MALFKFHMCRASDLVQCERITPRVLEGFLHSLFFGAQAMILSLRIISLSWSIVKDCHTYQCNSLSIIHLSDYDDSFFSTRLGSFLFSLSLCSMLIDFLRIRRRMLIVSILNERFTNRGIIRMIVSFIITPLC